MSRPNFKEVFNTKFMDLVKDLAKVFPGDQDFKIFPTTVRMAICANENLVRSVFHEKAAIPYKDKILAKDESFFLEHGYGDITDDVASAGGNAEDIIAKLKGCWAQLNEDNKVLIWKYLHLLILLDDKIAGL